MTEKKKGRDVPVRFYVYPLVIILGVSFSVYFNSLFNRFVYDDVFQVVKNPWITDIRYIPVIFLTKAWGFTNVGSSNYYRPMMHIAYMFTYYVFGLKAWGFHLVNVCLHACNSVIVFLVAWRLGDELEWGSGGLSGLPIPTQGSSRRLLSLFASYDSRSFAFIAALLFAVHPIHTEVVAWVAGLPDLAFTFFYLLSFYFFICSSPRLKALYPLSVMFFFISTLFKETALTLPLIIVAYDYVSHRPAGLTERVRRYLPFLAVMGIYFMMRVYALGGLAPENAHAAMSAYQYAINVFPLFSTYLTKLLFPINLSALYVFRPILGLLSPKGLLSLAVAVVFCFLVLRTRKKNRIAFLSLLFIVFPLLPTFYIPANVQPFAERYLYLPSFGFALVFSLALTKARDLSTNKAFSIATGALVLVLIGGYSVLTVQRNAVWRDSYSLWTDTVKKSPDSVIARMGLGNALLEDKGRLDDAIAEYKAALELSPRNPDIHDNLGFAFFKKGLIDEAIRQYEIALALDPRQADTRANLGLALARLGRTKDAMVQYRLAIAADPTFADPHDYLGVAYQKMGENTWAMKEFETAVQLDPSNAAFRRDLGLARKRGGDSKGEGE